MIEVYHMKTLKLKIFYRFYRSETLNYNYMKTIYLIELKLTGLIEWVNEDLYINFQSILNFHKNIYNFKFKGYGDFLWSWNYPYKLKQLKIGLFRIKTDQNHLNWV